MDDRRGQNINWTKLLGWVLTVAALVFVGRWLWRLDRSVWHQLTQLHIGWLAVSLGLLLGWFVLRFWAWRTISHHHGYQGPTSGNMRMWALSEFMRYIPGNVWSFAARWRGSIAAGVSKGAAVQSLVIEALGLMGGALVVAGIFVKPEWWWLVLTGLVAYLVVMPVVIRWVWRFRKIETVPPTLSPLKLSRLILVYALAWTMFGLSTVAVYVSFPQPPTVSLLTVLGDSVLAWILGYVSLITPMGLGVREAAFVVLLGPLVGTSFASLLSVMSRLWLVVSELVFVGLTSLRKRT